MGVYSAGTPELARRGKAASGPGRLLYGAHDDFVMLRDPPPERRRRRLPIDDIHSDRQIGLFEGVGEQGESSRRQCHARDDGQIEIGEPLCAGFANARSESPHLTFRNVRPQDHPYLLQQVWFQTNRHCAAPPQPTRLLRQ